MGEKTNNKLKLKKKEKEKFIEKNSLNNCSKNSAKNFLVALIILKTIYKSPIILNTLYSLLILNIFKQKINQ